MFRRHLPVTGIALSAALVAACAGTPDPSPHPTAETVYLTDEHPIGLRPPSELSEPVDILQRIEGAFSDGAMSLLAYVLADSRSVDMVFLNELGNEIGSLRYSHEGLLFTGLLQSQGVPGEYILFDFQLTYYDAKLLREALARHGVSLTVTTGPEEEIRIVEAGGETIVRIEKHTGSVRFENHLRGYSYTIHYEQ